MRVSEIKETLHTVALPVCLAGNPGGTDGREVDDRIRQAAGTIYPALIGAELTR